jgi:hypothetical protein
VTTRNVIVRRGQRFGWWVEGRKSNGKLFMKTWWPSEPLARAAARWWADRMAGRRVHERVEVRSRGNPKAPAASRGKPVAAARPVELAAASDSVQRAIVGAIFGPVRRSPFEHPREDHSKRVDVAIGEDRVA